VINRILAAPNLPGTVRSKVLEYVEEKMAGFYDHNAVQLRNFASRLSDLGSTKSFQKAS